MHVKLFDNTKRLLYNTFILQISWLIYYYLLLTEIFLKKFAYIKKNAYLCTVIEGPVSLAIAMTNKK